MKKIIRDRSIFVVLASIIMAGVMLFCSVRPMPVRLPTELRSIMGEQANTSFTVFFNELQDWYDSYEVTEEGVTLTMEMDYQPTAEVFFSIMDFLLACEGITDEEELKMVDTFSQPLMYFLTNYITILSYMEMISFFPLTAEEWASLGETITSMTALYRDYQFNFAA